MLKFNFSEVKVGDVGDGRVLDIAFGKSHAWNQVLVFSFVWNFINIFYVDMRLHVEDCEKYINQAE